MGNSGGLDSFCVGAKRDSHSTSKFGKMLSLWSWPSSSPPKILYANRYRATSLICSCVSKCVCVEVCVMCVCVCARDV